MNVTARGTRVRVKVDAGPPVDGTLKAFHPGSGDVTAPGTYTVNLDCPTHPEGHDHRVPESAVTFLEVGSMAS